MNFEKIGRYISEKRNDKKISVDELVSSLGVSTKLVMRWECGKELPNYSLVQKLCDCLGISVFEFFKGEDGKKVTDENIISIYKTIVDFEKQKIVLFGIINIILGVTLYFMSTVIGGTNFKDFFAGVLLGVSIVEMLIGIYSVVKNSVK